MVKSPTLVVEIHRSGGHPLNMGIAKFPISPLTRGTAGTLLGPSKSSVNLVDALAALPEAADTPSQVGSPRKTQEDEIEEEGVLKPRGVNSRNQIRKITSQDMAWVPPHRVLSPNIHSTKCLELELSCRSKTRLAGVRYES